MGGWMDRWIYVCMDRWIDVCMYGWMGRWMDGQMDGWMDGWIDVCTHGWMDRQTIRKSLVPAEGLSAAALLPPGLGGSDVGHPGYHGVWSSSPGLHPPRAGGPAPPLLKSHQPKMSPKIAQSPLGTKSPLVETCCSRFIHLGLEDRATRQGAFPCS